MLQKIKAFFDSIIFSKKELQGSIVLVVILGLVLVVPPLYRTVTPYEDEVAEKDALLLDSIVRELTLQQNQGNDSTLVINPNDLTFKEWVDLGASDFIASAILKEKERNGSFKCLDQILVVNGVQESHLSDYFQYFSLPDKCPKRKPKHKISFEINTVSKAELEQLGITGKIANRVLKYRKALGGFYSIDQVKEVYNISDSDFTKIKNSASIDKSKVDKIKINEISYFNLRAHPYISNKLASKITNYRNKIEKYSSYTDLEKVHGMTPEILSKLKPYIQL